MPITVLIGPPAAGKSSWARTVSDRCKWIEYDRLVKASSIRDKHDQVEAMIQSQPQLVWLLDDNHHCRAMRKRWFRLATELQIGIVFVVFEADLSVRLARNAARGRPLSVAEVAMQVDPLDPAHLPYSVEGPIAWESLSWRIPPPASPIVLQEAATPAHHCNLALNKIVSRYIAATPAYQRAEVARRAVVVKAQLLHGDYQTDLENAFIAMMMGSGGGEDNQRTKTTSSTR